MVLGVLALLKAVAHVIWGQTHSERWTQSLGS